MPAGIIIGHEVLPFYKAQHAIVSDVGKVAGNIGAIVIENLIDVRTKRNAGFDIGIGNGHRSEGNPLVAVADVKSSFGPGLNVRRKIIVQYGEVISLERVKRHEITEIPRDSDQLYYRLNIKE